MPTATQPATRPADVDPVPRVLPPPPEPKKGAKPKPDPNAAFVGPDGFKLLNPRTMEHDRELVFAHFTPCGKFLIAGSYDGRLYRWALDGDAVTPLAGHGGWVQGLAFHPDGRRAFSGDSWGTLLAWDYAAADSKPLWRRDDGHAKWMRSIALSPDGTTLATCGADRVVRLWSAADGSPVGDPIALPDDLLTVHFHPDGSLLVGDLKGVVRQFDAKARKLVRTLDASALYLRPTVNGFKEINDVGGVRCMASDPAGRWLVAGGTQPATSGFLTGKPTAVCFDFKTGTVAHAWQPDKAEPAEGFVMGLTWHPGGYFLAATSGQPGKGAVVGWRPGEAKEVYLARTFAHARTIAVYPDGQRVALVQVATKPGAGGGGNGRRLTAAGEYVGSIGLVKLFDATHGGVGDRL